jgi:hypothetical protein
MIQVFASTPTTETPIYFEGLLLNSGRNKQTIKKQPYFTMF